MRWRKGPSRSRRAATCLPRSIDSSRGVDQTQPQCFRRICVPCTRSPILQVFVGSNPMRRVTLSGSKLGPVSVRLERIEVGMARYTDSLMFRPVGFTRVEIVSLPGLLRPWQVYLMRLACGEAEPRYQGGLHRPLRRERQLDASDRQGCADRGIADPRYQRNAARF